MKKSFLFLVVTVLMISNANGTVVLQTDYQKSAPKFFMEDGKYTGLCINIITELNKRLKAKNIVIEPKHKGLLPLKRILQDLEKGGIELFVGTSRSKKREKMFAFADQPLYELSEIMAKRKSDPFEYTNINDLDGLRIVSLRGSNTAKRIFNVKGVKPHEVNSINQILLVLMKGRVDLGYYHNLGMEYYIRTMGIKDKVSVVKKPFRTKYHYIGFNKKVSPQIIKEINNALVLMVQENAIEGMRNKYK